LNALSGTRPEPYGNFTIGPLDSFSFQAQHGVTHGP
jgi:hypothetical protein